ncbi:MAG: hypothetical protein JWN57_2966 [Frankiales bacterium]|jgi:hypothetical protein|nr:hypothetical protein [Frankiales bacterium]
MALDDGSTRITPTGTDRFAETQRGTAVGGAVTDHMTGRTTVRPGDSGGLKHKTSAAAVFALVFGLAALFCALTAILSPAAVLFGIIGIVLGLVGLAMAKRPGVHGRGVAIGGLVTAILGLLLGGAVLAGLAAVVNNEGALNRISDQVDQLRDDIPSGDEVQNAVTP